ncbi:MAG: M20/M25/M40 family metallo-hydrolase [Planctomycetales bacterium]
MKTATSAPATLPSEDAAVLQLVLEMMAIPGKSGLESAIQKYIVDKLLAAGLPQSAITRDDTHKKSIIGGEVGNLIVKLPGTLKGPRRLLMAHVDTVPLCVGCKPERRGDVVRSADPTTALGADDRAGAAILLSAALKILRDKLPHPPLTFFWPVQEEIGLWGVRNAKTSLLGNPKLCFNWDGGDPRTVCIGATGAQELLIEIQGIASHAGVHPEAGVSALGVASLAISELQQNGWHGLIIKGKKQGTSNLGVVNGGDATNVVMPAVKIRGEVRSHDPKFRAKLVKVFETAFKNAVKTVKNNTGKRGKLNFEAQLKYESFRIDPKEPCVKEAYRAIQSLGLEPIPHISNGGLDANWLSDFGFPTVTLGCGQHQVHTVEEYLDIKEFLDGCRIGLFLATAGAAT